MQENLWGVMTNRVYVSTISWAFLCLDLCLIICFIVSQCFSYPYLKPETDPPSKKKDWKKQLIANNMQMKRWYKSLAHYFN